MQKESSAMKQWFNDVIKKQRFFANLFKETVTLRLQLWGQKVWKNKKCYFPHPVISL